MFSVKKIALSCGAGMLLVGLAAPFAVATAQPPAGAAVITVEGSRIGGAVSLGGTVVPQKEVTLAAQFPGRVEELAGQEGDEFKAGAMLVKLDEDDLLAQQKAAWADLMNADAQLRNAGVQYSREWVSPYGGQSNDAMGGMPSMFSWFSQPMRGMMPGGGSPGYDRHADLVQHGTAVEQARNAIVAARSRIDEIDAKLRDTKSVAPFDGVITRKRVEIGDTVQPGQPLVEFADTRTLQIKVEVPARMMPGLREGMVVPARLDVGNAEIQARVARIFPVADPGRHTVTVKLDVPPGAPAAPGMYAEVFVPDTQVAGEDLPILPSTALVWRGSLPGVYVLNAQNQPELRLVRLGDAVGPDRVAVLSGVRVGDRVLDGAPTSGAKAAWTASQ